MNLRFWLLALLWLPAGVVAITLARFGLADGLAVHTAELPMAAVSLAVVAPCGLPLALGCRRLWRLGRRRTAWAAGALLGSVTAGLTIIAGLLGPIAIAICAMLLSLPAWAMAWTFARRR